MKMKGSYILIIKLNKNIKLIVGSLGEIKFEQGYYTYFGSAFGPGGFDRIKRHKKISQGEKNTKHWHIDYLNSLSESKIIDVKKFPNQKIECMLAKNSGGKKVLGFGCSDCKCDSHLKYFDSKPFEYSLT